MKRLSKILTTLSLSGVMFFCANVNTANAQFSKAVVMLKGTIRTEQTGKAHSVKVSVREIGDKALEVTASRSNSESGNYLVVLKPGKKYWVHLEGDDIVTKDELVETPAVEKTEYIVRDFNVAELSGVGFGVAENKKVD